MNLQAGQHIGQYTITRRIGSGGMAVVYEATHNKLERRVAIKVMHAGFQDDADLLARFDREARIVAGLEHPNIVPVYDFDDHDGTPYLVMKFIEGHTLKWHMRKRALSLEEVGTIAGTVAEALTFAHEQGVLHRDVKPGNVILTEDGTPYLTDFGLARVAAQGESTLSAGMIVGTPHYLAPEQASGAVEVSAAADVYALGVMLYEMVVGQVPFAADSAHAIIHDHIYTPPPLPSKLNPEIPTAVEQVLLQSLEKEPQYRHQSAKALMDDFNHAVKISGLTELSDDRSELAARSLAKHRKANANASSAAQPVIPAPAHRETVEAEVDFANVVGDVKRAVGQVVQHARNAITGNTPAPVLDDPYTPPTADELDTQMRKRVKKRVKAQRNWWGHFGAYVMVNGTLIMSGGFLSRLGQEAIIGDMMATYALENTESAWAIIEGVNTAHSIDPVALAEIQVSLVAIDQPWVLVVPLLWAVGLAAHRVAVGRLSARTQDKQERRLVRSLSAEHGPNWPQTITQKQYKQAETRTSKRFDKLCGWWTHLWAYVFVNLALAVAWGMSTNVIYASEALVRLQDPQALPVMERVVNTPVYLIVSLFWGFGLLGHMIATVSGGGNRMERELARERKMAERRRTPQPQRRKGKRGKHTHHADDMPAVRLSDDGELTHSTADAFEQQEGHARR